MRAQHANVNIDVADRPRPSQANRPQRTCRTLARLLSRVHARQGESECPLSFGRQSPSCTVVLWSLQCSISNRKASRQRKMSDKETPMLMDESSTSESESSASSPSVERRQRWPRGSATPPEVPTGQEAKEASASATTTCRNEVKGSMGGNGGE